MYNIMFPNIPLDGVQGVLIDIDDTLYSYKRSHSIAIQECHKQYQDIFEEPLAFEAFYNNYRGHRTLVTQRLSPQGCCRSRLLAFQALFEEKKVQKSYCYASLFEDIYWQTFMKNMAPSESAFDFLKACKKKNIIVCAVTDMQVYYQIKKLSALGMDSLIDILVTSEEAGAEKPAPIIFEIALKKINLSVDQVIMIGDSLEKDIKGAEALGIKGYLVKQ